MTITDIIAHPLSVTLAGPLDSARTDGPRAARHLSEAPRFGMDIDWQGVEKLRA
jgi:hypothetical protein